MASCSGEGGVAAFAAWAEQALTGWGLDGAVLGAYIASIASEESPSDAREAMKDLLEPMIEKDADADEYVERIMEKWKSHDPRGGRAEDPQRRPSGREALNVEDRLVELLGSQSPVSQQAKQYTDEEKKIREAILKQYGQLSDDQEEGEASEGESGGNLVRNLNAATVAAAARERREQAKAESQKKKDKDKEDREKQKQLKEEKKEKRKTQKGERKR